MQNPNIFQGDHGDDEKKNHGREENKDMGYFDIFEQSILHEINEKNIKNGNNPPMRIPVLKMTNQPN